jgi:hypothetical protein
MQSTDIISAAGFGYSKVWEERRYLLQLGAVPFAIVLVSHALALSLTDGSNFIRQDLLLVPSMFAKGWMLAQFLRTLLVGERWPFRAENRGLANLDQLLSRARGILASMIIFVLINMIWLLVFSAIFAGAQEAAQTGQMETESVRYIWLYIPVSVLVMPGTFLRQIGGFVTSVHLLAVALICVVPLYAITVTIASAFIGDPIHISQISPIALAFVVAISQFMQMAIWCIVTAAVACMLRDYLPHQQGSLTLPEDGTR